MQAVLIACGIFALGLGLAVWNSRWKFADNATFVAIFLTPLLVYGIASGMVREFTGPGGWGAKFREAAQAKVAVTATSLTSLAEVVQKVEMVSKGGPAELAGLGASLPRNKPVALTFQLGQPGYNVQLARQYIQLMLLTDPQMSVLVIDKDRRFVAMTEGTTMLTMLNNPAQGQQIIAAISDGRPDYLLGVPGFHVNTVKADDSNATALERMRVENVQSIVVVDDDKRPAGIVKRDDLVARLLEKLATPDK